MSVDDSDIKMQLFILFANTSIAGQKNSNDDMVRILLN